VRFAASRMLCVCMHACHSACLCVCFPDVLRGDATDVLTPLSCGAVHQTCPVCKAPITGPATVAPPPGAVAPQPAAGGYDVFTNV
jgi:hypothetical protein